MYNSKQYHIYDIKHICKIYQNYAIDIVKFVYKVGLEFPIYIIFKILNNFRMKNYFFIILCNFWFKFYKLIVIVQMSYILSKPMLNLDKSQNQSSVKIQENLQKLVLNNETNIEIKKKQKILKIEDANVYDDIILNTVDLCSSCKVNCFLVFILFFKTYTYAILDGDMNYGERIADLLCQHFTKGTENRNKVLIVNIFKLILV